jgi:hypothetical protein
MKENNMIDADKIINDARNLEIANRVVQEERVKAALKSSFSDEDSLGIGLSDVAEIHVNSMNPDLATARLTGKKMIQGEECFFELQFGFRFSEVGTLNIGEGALHKYPYHVNVRIPLSQDNLENIQSINNKALHDLILRIGR